MKSYSILQPALAIIALVAVGVALATGTPTGVTVAMVALLVLTIVAAIQRHLRTEVERQRAAEMREDAVSAPPIDTDQKGQKSALSPRDGRTLELRDRDRTHLCRYCDQKAAKQVPHILPVRHALDWIYRRLNVIPVHQYRLQMEGNILGFPEVLCELHQELARGHVELEIAEDVADCARFAEKRRLGMAEFASYGLDERMNADAQAMRAKKPVKKPVSASTPVAEMAQPTRLRSVNGGG